MASKEKDYHAKLKEAMGFMSVICGVSEESVPSYLEPYKKALRSLSNKKDPDGYYLFDKLSKATFLNKLSKKEFKKLSAEFEKIPKKTANMLEFINIYLRNVTIPKEDSLVRLIYVVGLMDLFTEITAKKKKPFATWEEVNSVILSNYVEENRTSEFGITNKYVYKSETLKRAVSPRALAEVSK